MGRIAIVIALAGLVLGCGSAATPAPATAGLTPSVSVSPAPSASGAAETAGTDGPDTGAGGVDTGNLGPLADWSSAELYLLAGISGQLRDQCSPADELPEGAYAGVVCEAVTVDSIGYYLFEDRLTMKATYISRIAEYGVEPGSGEACMDGQPGEGVETPGVEDYEYRIACYVDDFGQANARFYIPQEVDGQHVYVGAVGTTDSISDLFDQLAPDRPAGMTGCGWCFSPWELETYEQ